MFVYFFSPTFVFLFQLKLEFVCHFREKKELTSTDTNGKKKHTNFILWIVRLRTQECVAWNWIYGNFRVMSSLAIASSKRTHFYENHMEKNCRFNWNCRLLSEKNGFICRSALRRQRHIYTIQFVLFHFTHSWSTNWLHDEIWLNFTRTQLLLEGFCLRFECLA